MKEFTRNGIHYYIDASGAELISGWNHFDGKCLVCGREYHWCHSCLGMGWVNYDLNTPLEVLISGFCSRGCEGRSEKGKGKPIGQ